MEIEDVLEKHSRDMCDLIESRIKLSAEDKMRLRRLFPAWLSCRKKILFEGVPSTDLVSVLNKESRLEDPILVEFIKEILELKNRAEYLAFLTPKLCEKYNFTEEELAAREVFKPLVSQINRILKRELKSIIST